MKKILTILLVLVSLNSYTQKLDSIPNTTETERIIDKYSDNIISGFNTAIEKVTPLAEDGFKVVVKLQFAKGVVYLLIPFGALIFWIMFFKNYKLALINQKENIYNDWVDCHRGTPAIAALILAIILTLGSLPAIYHGVLHVITPEWFAIKEIMNLF